MSSIDAALRALDDQVSAIASACTRCGKCAEACPMPDIVGLAGLDGSAMVEGVMQALRGDDAPAESKRWAEVCSGSGHCIEACPEQLNPRFLLAMLRRRETFAQEESARRAAGRAAFRKMARGVSVLSRLQLPPAWLERLSPSSHPRRNGQETDSPDVVFYTGCNMLKTPHIGLLCLEVLDRLDVR